MEPGIAEPRGGRRSAGLGHRLLTVTLWPGLLALCLAVSAYGMSGSRGVVWFNGCYLCLAVVLALLERMLPHDRAWLRLDDQILPDLLHTVLTKGTVQVALAVTALFGYASLLSEEGAGLWPSRLPQPLQILLALLIAEFGLYWSHRIAHEWPLMWRFHAVHHSVERLWFFNTGRFHFVDTLFSIALSQPLLLIAGAPGDVVIWVAMITAFIGLLTHCNVDMRTGWLDYVFNTPTLHRWHHSRDPKEGNSNYGENLVLWDLMFGSFYRPARTPPSHIGIDEPMPRSFLGQLAHPFRRRT